jgi:RNA polymerase sigma factor (sigma-70 family)
LQQLSGTNLFWILKQVEGHGRPTGDRIMDGATQPAAEQPAPARPKTSRAAGEQQQLQSARVAELLALWRPHELRLALGYTSGLPEHQLEDLYQETTLALLRRPFANERHLQRALRQGIKRRALNANRDERTRAQILANAAPGIHILEEERAAEQTPEQFAALREDRLLVTEFLTELTVLERRVYWLSTEGMKYNRIAKTLGEPVNKVRNALRSCEQKRERFQLLYDTGRLCGYRARTIKALQQHETTSEQLAQLAFAHIDACAYCRAEHKTNAARLRHDFQSQAAELLPPVLLSHLNRLQRAGIRTRLISHRIAGSGLPVGGGVRERAATLIAGGTASAKVAAGIVTAAAVITAGTITATHEQHRPPAPKHAQTARTTEPPPALARAIALPASLTVPADHAISAEKQSSATRREHIVPRTTPLSTDTLARGESGGFAYLGLPARPATAPSPEPEPRQIPGQDPFSP